MYKVSILIPTKNRYFFLERIINYYIKSNCEHILYIGDGSDISCEEEISVLKIHLKSNIDINYYHLPNLNDRETISFLAKQSKEKYCAFVADDDFLIPDSLSICAKFLENNLDYRTSQGNAILFSLHESGPYGKVKGSQVYWKNIDSNENTGHERVMNFSNNYWVPQFSVHRTAEFISDSKFYEQFKNKKYGEIFHNFIFICNGKSKFIDCLYLVRQGHDQRYLLPDFYEWITSCTWNNDYLFFIEKLSDEILQVDNISKVKAKEIATTAIKNYLISFSINSNKKYLIQTKKNLYKKVKYFLVPYYLKYFHVDVFTKLISKNSKDKIEALKIYNLITKYTYVK
jgi:glycosyltransferase domain-containing protein